MTLAIGFDIGGSTVRAALVRLSAAGDYTILARQKHLLTETEKTPDAIVGSITRLVGTLGEDASEAVDHVGIGICAQLTDGGRTVANSPNLHWRDVALGDLLDAALPGQSVSIVNDLNAILWGEYRFGTACDCRHVLAVYPGTGIGGAALIDGRLVEGSRGFAGEIGHVVVGGDIACGCGQTGCLETIGGGHYIEARIAADLASGALDRRHYGPGPSRLRPGDIDRAFAREAPYAQGLWREIASEMGRTIAALVAFLNPEMVLMGGGVIEHCPRLFELIAREIDRRAPAVCSGGLQIERGQLGGDAGILGAAASRG